MVNWRAVRRWVWLGMAAFWFVIAASWAFGADVPRAVAVILAIIVAFDDIEMAFKHEA